MGHRQWLPSKFRKPNRSKQCCSTHLARINALLSCHPQEILLGVSTDLRINKFESCQAEISSQPPLAKRRLLDTDVVIYLN